MSASANAPPAAGGLAPSGRPGRQPEWRPLLLAIFALGCAARLWHLGTQSLSMDEVTELRLAADTLPGLIGADDGFPPLFSLLLHGWVSLFGEPAARGLSALLGIAALPFMWLLGRELGGPRVGALGMLLLAVSPLHVWYAQDIRPYSLYLLLAVLTLWRFAVARRTEARRDWLLYALVGAAGLYTHYYFGLLTGSLAALDLLDQGSAGVRLGRMVRRHAPIALLALPLVPLLLPDIAGQQAFQVMERPLDLQTVAYTFLTYLSGFSLGPSLRELHSLRPREALLGVLPWALPLGAAALYLAVAGLRAREWRRTWLALALLALLPLAVCAVLGAALGFAYRPRYVAWGAIPTLLLLALGVVADRRRWPAGLALMVIVLEALVAIVNRHAVPRYWNEDARGAAEEIARAVPPGGRVFVISGYMAGPIRRYLGAEWPLRAFALAETAETPDSALAEIRAVGKGQPFWLVYSRPFDGDPAGRMREALTSRAGLRLRRALPGIELYQGTGW